MKEIPIASNNKSNHDAGEETDPYEDIDEKTENVRITHAGSSMVCKQYTFL